MEKVFGVLIALAGAVIVAIYSYICHRSIESLLDRATGEGKPPCRWLLKWDHEAAAKWAKDKLANPESTAIIDITESGPGNRDIVIELAAIDSNGTVLFHSLINAGSHPLNPRTCEEHGLEQAHIENYPGFEVVWPEFVAALGERSLLCFAEGFVSRIMQQTCRRNGLDTLPQPVEDMQSYLAAYHGQWESYEGH